MTDDFEKRASKYFGNVLVGILFGLFLFAELSKWLGLVKILLPSE